MVGGPVDTCVIMCYVLGQYSPYTFTVAILDTTSTDLASLLTLHLYMYCPIAKVVSVVYNVVLSLLTVVQLPSIFLSQEYVGVPKLLAIHSSLMFPFTGTSPPTGWSVISGTSIK